MGPPPLQGRLLRGPWGFWCPVGGHLTWSAEQACPSHTPRQRRCNTLPSPLFQRRDPIWNLGGRSNLTALTALVTGVGEHKVALQAALGSRVAMWSKYLFFFSSAASQHEGDNRGGLEGRPGALTLPHQLHVALPSKDAAACRGDALSLNSQTPLLPPPPLPPNALPAVPPGLRVSVKQRVLCLERDRLCPALEKHWGYGMEDFTTRTYGTRELDNRPLFGETSPRVTRAAACVTGWVGALILLQCS